MNAFNYFFSETGQLTKDLVLGPREQISYRQLYDNCLKLAIAIEQRVGTDKNLILISENSVFFITVYLAILKSGNICIPLNPNIEADGFIEISGKTSAELIFISNRFRRKYSDLTSSITDQSQVDLWMQSVQFDPDITQEADFDDSRVAEIIFTSGSTGEQKGVVLTHKNLIANTSSILRYLHLTSDDTIEIVMPFYYCYGLSLLHTHIKVGGSVVLNNSFIFLGSVINDLIQYKCTGFAGVPSHYQILLRKSKDFMNTKFPHLRYVAQAGGKLHNVFIREFINALPDIKFFVMYGQTEATARLSYLPPEKLRKKMGSIGKGIPGVELKVINSSGNDVAPGEIGEIIARGDNIMKGYFKDKKSSKKALRDGWLYTGDMAVTDEKGYIYIQSRKKEIIKVRGIRISPKEIEEVIVGYPGVVDCTVVAENDEILGEAIKAIVYVNDVEVETFKEEYIKLHCSRTLSKHKIPQTIVFSNKLAFNATGKKPKRKELSV